MRNVNRVDIIPAYRDDLIKEALERAKKYGIINKDILDINIDGVHCKELLYSGTKIKFIKYWGVDLLRGDVRVKDIPSLLKLMFLTK